MERAAADQMEADYNRAYAEFSMKHAQSAPLVEQLKRVGGGCCYLALCHCVSCRWLRGWLGVMGGCHSFVAARAPAPLAQQIWAGGSWIRSRQLHGLAVAAVMPGALVAARLQGAPC